jgi:AcrR family transcriptional regulator
MTSSLETQSTPEADSSRKDTSTALARTRRRDARREQSRTEILEAAERVFGEDGIRDGSLRRIASLSGFSAGALYLFFENKADLLSKTLARRGDEWSAAVGAIVASDAGPLKKLHQVIDFAEAFLTEHPHFRQLLHQVSHGTTIAGHNLAAPHQDDDQDFTAIMTGLAGVIESGQKQGDIRPGDARALTHLFTVLVNEYVLLGASPGIGRLTSRQFHEFVDGALRTNSAR